MAALHRALNASPSGSLGGARFGLPRSLSPLPAEPRPQLLSTATPVLLPSLPGAAASKFFLTAFRHCAPWFAQMLAHFLLAALKPTTSTSPLGAPCPSPSALVLAFTLAHSTFVYTVCLCAHSLALPLRILRYFSPRPVRSPGLLVAHAARTPDRYKRMRRPPLLSTPHAHRPGSYCSVCTQLLRTSLPCNRSTHPSRLIYAGVHPPSRSFALCKPVVVTAHLLAAPFSLALPIHPLVWLACNAHPSTLSPPLHPLPVAVWHVRERRTLRAAASAALVHP
ncbi:hypothetical protein B0H14DRAFT_3464134 [Mycena olivaceomarginata]|nr:hypothetical protein B0H14DRAFT_3464134 [Mycena olivaceomarginata]